MDGVWVPIIMFASIAVVLSFWFFFRFRERQALQQTVQAAIEKGHDLSPEFLASLGQPKTSGSTDLRRGVTSMAIGIAFVILAFVLDEQDAIRPLLGAAAFPVMIGVAYLSLWRFAGKSD